MLTLPGYQILAKIYESARSLVYRGIRETDSQGVILKVLKQDYPTPAQLSRYQQEYQITHTLNLEGVIKAYSLEHYQNTLVIIFEDIGGKSLKRLIKDHRLTLAEFLNLALNITEAVGTIHTAKIIHKDINPSNILVNPATGQVKLIDFGISTVLSRENPTLKNPQVLEGTLAYMSPEQTGRMNRFLDYRTDFYALGATFYELLTHQLPFETTDPMELVHCHLAKQPTPPHELNPEIPKAISNIVMKLLAKTASERYQSAWGIQCDLVLCLMQLEANGKIENFSLGENDVSQTFQLPEKIYGRKRELETLLTAFFRVACPSDPKVRGGEDIPIPDSRFPPKSELMLVVGYSGIGKSALVAELYKPITQQNGYFIAGKFDQLQRNSPYSAFIQAFQTLITQLLTEGEDQLQQWREKILRALGVNGQIIIDVIPEVELIIGQQSALPELLPDESQNRFRLVFQNFIQVFTQPEHPLVIFLDDLQWADTASVQLVQLLMTAPDSHYLFLIGAYRDNEVNQTHPLRGTVDKLKNNGVVVNQISLSPLSIADVNQLVADTLHCSGDISRPFAELVLAKTGGNPFFINEFLKSLYAENLLTFNLESLSWQWDLEQIQEQGITDNIVELMALKLQKLPSQTQQVLILAACMGNQFDLKTVAIVSEQSLQETTDSLQEAVAEGLIFPLGDIYTSIEEVPKIPDLKPETLEYKFAHDRIQQAAYSLIPLEDKPAIHRQIGQLLLQSTPPQEREQKIFELVNQLNLGIDLISTEAERYQLLELNLMAGKKAKASAAYEPALNYLKVGLTLLSEESWIHHYELTLAFYVQGAETAYLCGDFEQMDAFVEVVLQRANSLLDQVNVYEVQLQAYMAQNKLLEVIKTALPVLELLGVNLPKSPQKWHTLLGLIKIKLTLARKPIQDLINLPPMSDPYKLAAMRILLTISSAAYFAAPELLPLIIFKQIDLSLKGGNASESAFAYGSYGLILCGVVGDIEGGYQFGQLALRLLERLNAKPLKARVFILVNTFIRQWKESVRETLNPLREGYQIGLETGDLEYGAYCANIYSCHAYFIGQELTALEREIATYRDAIAKLKQETALNYSQVYHQQILNLLGRSENPCLLIGDSYDERQMLPRHQQANDRSAMYRLYFNKLILCYLFGEYQQAIENADLGARYISGATGSIFIPIFYFYDSLARLAVYPQSQNSAQKRLLRQVKANQKKMKKWAHYAPMNHWHKFYLVEAERYRVSGRETQAMDYYDRAIALAKEHQYLHEEALANELAARFYLAKGKTKLAQPYLLDAHYGYLRWGATAKVQQLKQRYPQLLTLISTGSQDPTSRTLTASNSGSKYDLDFTTVMKACQAISGEIVLDRLLATLMKILIENAGAEVGYLILPQGDNLVIKAEGAVNRDLDREASTTSVLESIPLENSEAVSATIIKYVARTSDSVVLNDATCEGNFTQDPYILKHQPKSILCAPLMNQGQLVSIVYLENNLTPGAFSAERLEIVKLLSAQAAISIKNAQLYCEVTESEQKLTQFLEAMPVGVAVVESCGKPYYINQKAHQLLGKGVVPSVTLEQIAEVYQLYIPGTNQTYPVEDLSVVRALKGESATATLDIHQGDKIIPIETWGTPIFDDKGNVAYAILAFQDITDRQKAEAEREGFTHELFQLNQAYERFVPRQFLQFLQKETIVDVELGDQVQQEMSVLFSDIRNFTPLSESMTPEENFKFINSYLSRMEPIISANQGFIDKYIGDAIMALFSGDADNAVKAGIAMLQNLTDYNQQRQNYGYVPIRIGIGINTGSLMLGTVGGQNRMDSTVISDAVNLAARIEDLTKEYGVSLLISHHTLARLQNPTDYSLRLIDQVKVKGKSQAVAVFEVFEGDPPTIRDAKLATTRLFEEGLLLYFSDRFPEAAQRFTHCLQIDPEDTVAQIYLERCQRREFNQ